MSDLKINMKFGAFELNIEGEKETIKDIFNQVKSDVLPELIKASSPIKAIQSPQDLPQEPDSTNRQLGNMACQEQATSEAKATPIEQKRAKNSLNKLETYQLVSLNLPKDKITLLISEYKKYSVSGAFDTLALLFYLYRGLSSANNFDMNLAYTLLKTVGAKVPKVLSQTLRDLRGKKEFVSRNEDGTYSLTHIGDNYVEHVLTKTEEQ